MSIANQWSSQQGTIDKNSNQDLLNAAIDTVWNRRNEFVGALAQFFDEEKKDSGLSHIITSVGSALALPQKNGDTEPLPYLEPAPGFNKTFTLLSYRSGIRVTDTMMKADRFDKVAFMVTGQVKSAMQKDEYLRAAILNGAFTGDGGADSKDLCDDDHPQENPGRGTWDNKGTGAMTGANVQALRLLGANMTNEQGDPDPAMVQTLVVPPALEQKASELTESKQRAEDALNGNTVLIGNMKVIVSPYLGLNSAVQYFGFANREGPNKGLHQFTLIPWNIKNNNPSNADIIIDKRIKGVHAIGFTLSKNIYGSTGA